MREIKKKSIQSRKEFQNHDIDAEAHIYAGKRWKEIIQAAREYSGTCIVMGATARICLTKPVFNTCSWRVAQASTLPTIVIP